MAVMNTTRKLDRLQRLALAAGVAAIAGLSIGVQPVAACTYVPPTLAEQAGRVDMIFFAEVADVPADRTYVLETGQVFRGSVPDTITFAPDEGEGVSSCEASLRDGATYLFGVNDFDGVLGLGEVWFRIFPNRVEGSFIFPPPTTDPDALIALLEGLPDTALPPSAPATDPARFPVTELGILCLAGAAIVWTARRRLSYPRRPTR